MMWTETVSALLDSWEHAVRQVGTQYNVLPSIVVQVCVCVWERRTDRVRECEREGVLYSHTSTFILKKKSIGFFSHCT